MKCGALGITALLAARSALAADVYYSVGQNTLDHKTGAPHVALTAGVARFDIAQTASNLGAGDELDYDTDDKKAYLAVKIDSQTWRVTTVLGATPADSASVTVNAIRHTFSSLMSAMSFGAALAGDSSHLGTMDLADAGITLHIACFCDTGPELISANEISIDGTWVTSATSYLHIFAPNDPKTDCNVSQRHSGVWDPTKFALRGTNVENIIDLYTPYARIEGLQFSVEAPGDFVDAIDLRASGMFDVTDNLIIGRLVGTANSCRGIEVEGGGYGPDLGDAGVARIWNNIISGFKNPGFGAIGIAHNYQAPNRAVVFNNTLFEDDVAFVDQSIGNSVLKNNLFYGNNQNIEYPQTTAVSCNNLFGPLVDANVPMCGVLNGVTVAFVDAGTDSPDLHLARGDIAIDAGLNLAQDPDLAFAIDIDGDPRPMTGAWDIGADQHARMQVFDAGSPDSGSTDGGSSMEDAGVTDAGSESDPRRRTATRWRADDTHAALHRLRLSQCRVRARRLAAQCSVSAAPCCRCPRGLSTADRMPRSLRPSAAFGRLTGERSDQDSVWCVALDTLKRATQLWPQRIARTEYSPGGNPISRALPSASSTSGWPVAMSSTSTRFAPGSFSETAAPRSSVMTSSPSPDSRYSYDGCCAPVGSSSVACTVRSNAYR